MQFKIGDRVAWDAKYRGQAYELRGSVVAVVPAGGRVPRISRQPSPYTVILAAHLMRHNVERVLVESYLVSVPRTNSRGKLLKPFLYRPKPHKLRYYE